MTSHDCVAKVRRIFQTKKVGHAGTLDPAAVGVLPIALGKVTRLLQFLPENKVYQATIRLGVQTTTDDLEGEIMTSIPCPDLDINTIKNILQQSFIGKIQQIPPRYSAIQIGGKRLYDLARQGQEVEIPARSVEIDQIEVLEWRIGTYPEIVVEIACGPGTYIRSIARDLGKLLNVGATLAHLIRLESGGFKLRESVTFEQLEAENFALISAGQALAHLPKISLPAPTAHRWCQGQKISDLESLSNFSQSTYIRVNDEQDQLLGIGNIQSSVLLPQVVLATL